MVANKTLAILFSLLILGQAYCVKRAVGTWLFPASLFGLVWFAYTFIPLVVLFWVPIQPYGIAYIFLCTLALSAASLPFSWTSAFRQNLVKRDRADWVYGSRFLKFTFCASSLAALVFFLLNSLLQGFSVTDLLFDLFASASAYATMRYEETLASNIYLSLALICTYVGVTTGGLFFPSIKSIRQRFAVGVLAFLPSVFVAVTQSAKGLLGLCIVLFCAGVLARRVLAANMRLADRRNIKILAIAAAIVFAVLAVSFLAGGLYKVEDRPELTERLFGMFATYFLGHPYAFADWFSFMLGAHTQIPYTNEACSYGFYTFAPILRALGNHKIVPFGVYDDYYVYGNVLVTNIYTMFRGLVTDFGFLGSVVFMFCAGLVLHWMYYLMLIKKNPVFTVVVFVFALGAFYESFGISLLYWGSIYVAFLLTWGLLQVNASITREREASFAAPSSPAMLPAPPN